MAAPGTWNPEGFRVSDGALLAGAKPAAFIQINSPENLGQKEPKLTGGFDKLMADHPGIEAQAYNLIKKCPQCGKPCATTMSICNGCAAPLADVPVTKAPNLFTAMIFGVDKIPFPLKISMRSESASMLVFDDPLAITRAHILAVPTDVYCADIRSLFLAPEAALGLLQRMEEAAWLALSQGPLADESWRKKALSKEGSEMNVEDLRRYVVRAFNMPPSQYQLHMQYMLPPMLPSHVGVFRRGAHFMKMRHFPCGYVQEACRALVAAKTTIAGAPQMDAEQLVEAIKAHGVDYDKAWADDMEFIKNANSKLANWDPADFEYAVNDGQVSSLTTGAAVESPTAKELDNLDKLAMQGYGRPYTDGKPGGMYYSFARDPALLPTLQ